MASLNQNISKLKDLLDEPDVKLNDLNQAVTSSQDEDIKAWVKENLEESSRQQSSSLDLELPVVADLKQLPAAPITADQDESLDSGSTGPPARPLFYKIVALPNISAFSKEVRRGTFGFEKCTYEDKELIQRGAPESVPKLSGLSAPDETGMPSGTMDSGALSLPSIGACRKVIDRRKFHQDLRSSQELRAMDELEERSQSDSLHVP